jgi:hypothetical protein
MAVRTPMIAARLRLRWAKLMGTGPVYNDPA